MNLAKLFNAKYLLQNLKKSRVTLAFVLLILPILNLLVFFMQGTNNSIMVFGLNEISPLTIVGMYTIPIILSLILFSYVFKKKSIDFIGSMPLDRKTIFVTNTISGVLIIASLIAITAIFMLIASAILPNVYVPMGVFLDYFILYTLSYIFVFVICNLALSLSGNIPTTLALTALILFLVPFLHFVYYETHYTHEEVLYECPNCITTEEISNYDHFGTGLSKIDKPYHYTTPSEVLNKMANGYETSLYNDAELGKMALLTILYALIGLSLFQKKELEVSETSFKNIKTHMFVKSLTMIPIVTFIYEVTKYSNFVGFLFAISLLLIYSFVFDLITRRSISHIKINLCSFVITLIILFPLSAWLTGEFVSNDIKTKIIDKNDISKVELLSNNISFIDKIGGKVTIKDKDLYDLLLVSNDVIDEKEFETTINEDGMVITEEKEIDVYYSLHIKVYTKDANYEGYVDLNEKELKELEEKVTKMENYQKLTNKNLKDAEIATLSRGYTKLTTDDLDLLQTSITNPSKKRSTFFLPITVYHYKNHEIVKENYNSNLTANLNQAMVDRYNESFINYLDKNKTLSCNWLDITDEYTYDSYGYNHSDCLKYLSLIKKQTTSVNQKLYKFTVQFDNEYYYYYANLSDEALKTFKIKPTTNVETEGDIPNVD